MDSQIILGYLRQKIALAMFEVEAAETPNGWQVSLVCGQTKVTTAVKTTENLYEFPALDRVTKDLSDQMLEKLNAWRLNE